MIAIENILVSDAVVEKQFVCDLHKCKGQCCVLGDEGAPLEPHEQEIIEQNFSDIERFLSPEGKQAIEKEGKWVKDKNGTPKTPLINGAACAYVIWENGITKCGIEKAWEAGAITFRKPISCHLYPIRIKKLSNGYEAVNYERWSICKDACSLGKSLQVPVYKFLKDALIRKYGNEFYDTLEAAAGYADTSK